MTIEGHVVLVATPIGNLGDITVRALETLRTADWIYAEDTRHSRGLLTAHGVEIGGRLRSLHEHSEHAKSPEIVRLAQAGAVVAYVSDAGTPGISDPGAELVRACIDAGVRVEMLPGANAVLPAVVLSGFATNAFVFLGFLDRKGAQRSRQLDEIARSPYMTIVYESPRRLAATVSDLGTVCGLDREIAVARELTKVFEQVCRGPVSAVVAAIEREELPQRGECVIAIAPASTRQDAESDRTAMGQEIDALLASGMRTRDIADVVASQYGIPKKAVYELALDRSKLRLKPR